MFDPSVPSPSSQLHHETLAEATTRVIREKILSGELVEGAVLRQDALASQYGISRIPVREALRQLEAEGLVRFYPHRGAVVSSLSLEEIEELFDVRAMIEPDLLRRAIPRMTPAVLDRAGEILEMEAAAFECPSDIGAWGKYNWMFHSTLYRPANRPQTMEIIERLNRNVDRYLRIQLVLTQGTTQAVEDHAALLDACRRRDVRNAVRMTKEHILNASRGLIACLSQERPEQAIVPEARAATKRK